MTIVHIVHFGFEPSVSPAEKKEIADRFLQLRTSCRSQSGSKEAYIVDLQGGVNNSPEGAANGLEVRASPSL